MSIITVIGAGVMGSAMSFPACDNGHIVRLVGTMLDRDIITFAKQSGFHKTLDRKLPDNVECFQLEELQAALDGVDMIISGVSSFGVEWFCKDILPSLPNNVPVISVTKGMLNNPDGSISSYIKYYETEYPDRSFLAIGGPCTSYELADRDNSFVGFCGNCMDSLLFAKEILESPYYHISLTKDVEGFECAVALKNAYALAVSLAVGLSLKESDILHYNSQAALFTQSTVEIRRLLALFGFYEDNLAFSIGDLYVTIFGGRTRRVGTLFGMGYSFDEVMKELNGVTLESIVISERIGKAILTCVELDKTHKEHFPLLLHIYDIITANAPVNIPWKQFG